MDAGAGAGSGTGSGTGTASGASNSVEFDYNALLSADVIAVVLIAVGLGVLGGLARMSRDAMDPASPKPGFGQYVGSAIVGGVAGVAAFYVLTPGSPLKFVSACLIAGYAGPALMDALEARFKVLMAEARANHAVEAGSRALDIADAALASGTSAPSAPNTPSPGATAKAEIARMRAELEALRVRT